MNLNKTLGRVATTFVAGAMLTALAMPAYAVTATTGNMQYTDSTVSFNASVDMTGATEAGMPHGTFSFTVGALSTLPEGHEDSAVLGTVDDVVSSTVTVNFDGETVNNTEQVTFSFKADAFGHAGVYYYTVTQTDPDIAGMTADTSTYIMKVYVENIFGEDGALTGNKVANVTMYKQGDTETTKVGGIENDYATESVKLTKQITGAGANMGESFSFTIELTDPDHVAHMTSISYKVNDAEAYTPVIISGNKFTVTLPETLGDDDYVTVTGLPVGTNYKISETDAEAYVTTWAGVNTSITTEAAGELDTKIIDGTVSNGENDITVTNSKASSPATGIVMNVAPYVLLVVVAAAGCFVFLRKRRED